MANLINFTLFLFVSSLCLRATLGEVICEELPQDVCAFSISASAKRCILETSTKSYGEVEYQCKTSDVIVESMSNFIESDECVKSCGVDRKSVGISSDTLLETQFTSKLCSPACYQKCPNIVDLYFNLAAGEGAFLPDLCEAQRANPHRSMIENILSSGATTTAPAPITSASSEFIMGAPSPAPL